MSIMSNEKRKSKFSSNDVDRVLGNYLPSNILFLLKFLREPCILQQLLYSSST